MSSIQKITTIESLLSNLEMGLGIDGYLGLMHQIDIHPDELESSCIWNDSHYTRKLIYRADTFEVLLMCWSPGNKSLIHSYDDQQGWVKVVKGELDINYYLEQSYGKKMEIYKSKTIRENEVLYINDYLGFHSISNNSDDRVISLHIHADPVKNWKVYDPLTDSFFKTNTIVEQE